MSIKLYENKGKTLRKKKGLSNNDKAKMWDLFDVDKQQG